MESNLNPYGHDDAHLLFHEMEHSVQYAARGGIEPFLSEYVTKSIGGIIAKENFNIHTDVNDIHDNIDIESAAINKSNEVSQAVDNMGWTFLFQNDCRYPITVAIEYQDDSGQLKADGYWNINPKIGTFLGDENNVRIRTKNPIYYYYAEAPGHNLVWGGNQQATVPSDGRSLGFGEGNTQGYILSASRSFSCD
jgi:Protein of unknown function (DUF1036)